VGLWQALFFILLCAVVFPAGAYITRFLPVNFDPFDWAVGGIFGGVTSLLIVHFLLGFLLVASSGFPMRSALEKSFLVRQVVYLDGANELSTYLLNLGSDKPIHAPD
ncbi:MAG TPA: hypothetical protein VGL77_07685, partial [Armatimonadota bacterium]